MEQLEAFFSGLKATIDETKKVREQYNPLLAFDFNSLEFYSPKETKITEILKFFLDPNNTKHGQGNLFLKIFIEELYKDKTLELEKENLLNFNKIEVNTNYRTNEDRLIDIGIVFGDKDFAIGIESKFWGAEEQTEQLYAYNKYLNTTFDDKYLLLFVPRFQGDEPTSLPSFNDKKRFRIINFEIEILNIVNEWRIRCQAERVRSFLIDFGNYINTTILGKLPTDMEKNIVEFIESNPNYINVAFDVEASIEEIKKRLVFKFKELIIQTANKLGLVKIKDDGFGEKDCGLFFNKAHWDSLTIWIGFETRGYENFKFWVGNVNNEKSQDIFEYLKEVLSNNKEFREDDGGFSSYSGVWNDTPWQDMVAKLENSDIEIDLKNHLTQIIEIVESLIPKSK